MTARNIATATPDPDHGPVHARLTDKGAACHIAKDPRVGAGEAYMDGRLVIEPPSDIRDLVLLIRYNAPFEKQGALKPQGPVTRRRSTTSPASSTRSTGRAARAAMPSTPTTSPGGSTSSSSTRTANIPAPIIATPTNSLEQAQLDKKAHIAAKLNLKPGMKVLDIGCGWGGLALYLHRHYDVRGARRRAGARPDRILQRARRRQLGVADKVKFELMDYRDVEGQFDRITSVGLIEHLGTPHHPGFFAKTLELLKPDGVMFSHCCGRMGGPGVTDKWTRKYIFPGGYIPALSELVTAGGEAPASSSPTSRRCATIMPTRSRNGITGPTPHQEEITALYDERFFRMWQFYLVGAEAAFRYGGMVNWQLQYVKRRDAIPMTCDYMYEEERRLHALDEAARMASQPGGRVRCRR